MERNWVWTAVSIVPLLYYSREMHVLRDSFKTFFWLSILMFFAIGIAWCNEPKAGMLIIANSDVPVKQLTLNQLSAIYLTKRKTWPNGERIIPINREAGSKVRSEFSRTVFNEPPEALTYYWIKMQFKGDPPPLIQHSNKGVLLFVQRVPGTIGYINQDSTPNGVKVLASLPSKKTK